MADFNSRAHARRDGIFEKILIDIQHFNSRAHARRDSTKRSDKSENTNFNSRAHARRDGVIFLLDEIQIISTHAPTQGATGGACNVAAESKFQLTRPRKAQHICHESYTATCNFNSRAHARRDRDWMLFGCSFQISTHAPTQGAT